MTYSSEMPRNIAARAVVALGALLGIIGLTLFLGGVKLAWVGGSWYYFIAGAGLLLSSWFLIHRRMRGAWIYVAVFAFTLLWALSESGFNGWALVPRLLGPFLLLLLVIASLPVLDRERGPGWLRIGGAAWLVSALLGGVVIHQVNRADEANAMPAQFAEMGDPSPLGIGSDWPAFGGTYAARRYSPLTQITRDNVRNLEIAWVYRTGDTPEEDFGAETTPIKIGDAVYLCSSRNIIIALNASSGEELWRHDPQVSDDYIPYIAACRGVTYHASPAANVADGCDARIIVATLDARLIAVNASNGTRCAGFGRNGEISITEGMGEIVPGRMSERARV